VPSPAADPLSSTDLAAFVHAMEAGSVHGAADALGLTPSAISKRLRSLEQRTGVVLFERGRFGLRSTPAARVLYPEAKAALTTLGDAERAVREHRDLHPRSLSLSASHTIGEFLLPGWLAAFRSARPEIRVQIDIINSLGVLTAVRNGDADIGFIEGIDPIDGLETLTLHRDALVLVVAPTHPWARRRSVPARELLAEPYLAREAGSGTRAVAAAALATHAIELTPALEVASSQSLKRTLESGGFALMSALAVTTEVQAGTLRTLGIRDIDLTRALRAVRDPRPRPPASSEAAAFWDWLSNLSLGD
jgi:DNA-binding transcriptional LysR family regulator